MYCKIVNTVEPKYQKCEDLLSLTAGGAVTHKNQHIGGLFRVEVLKHLPFGKEILIDAISKGAFHLSELASQRIAGPVSLLSK